MRSSAIAEPVSFDALVALHRPALLRYARRILGDPTRAEDAVQQTFLDAYVALAGGTEVRAVKPWLYRIAHNTSLNLLRDRVAVAAELTDDVIGAAPSAAADAESRERLHDVLAAVQALPPRQRDAIVLRELEGRSYDEIARALQVGDGAVRQLLNRARHTVRAGVSALTPPVVARVAEVCSTSSPAVKACAGAMAAGAASFVVPPPPPPPIREFSPPRVSHGHDKAPPPAPRPRP